jgi:uncharacterized protein YrrD
VVPLVIDIEGRPITGVADVELGTVARVLFHPSEPRVVGIVARPPAVLHVIERGTTYLPLAGLTFGRSGTHVELRRLPKLHVGAESLGFDPDTTVIWTGMDVRGPSEALIGRVEDVDFDPETGLVSRMSIAGGLVADAAHGRYVVTGDRVAGYRDGAIRIAVESSELPAAGGLAKSAATAAVAVSEAARKAGVVLESGVVGASAATGKAIREVAGSGAVEKAAGKAGKRMRGTWSDMKKAFRDGIDGDGS